MGEKTSSSALTNNGGYRQWWQTGPEPLGVVKHERSIRLPSSQWEELIGELSWEEL